MMDFWDLSDGGSAADTGTEYEIPGGNMAPIPDGSTVLALVDEAKWDAKNEADHISLRWSVLAPEEYKNRKVFQKLWVTDDDPGAKDADRAAKKRDKARRMLAAIDANAGGGLAKGGLPTDDDLVKNLANKPMVIKLMIWSLTDATTNELVEGNWICAVAPKSGEIHVAPEKPRAKPSAAPGQVSVGIDDEIPF